MPPVTAQLKQARSAGEDISWVPWKPLELESIVHFLYKAWLLGKVLFTPGVCSLIRGARMTVHARQWRSRSLPVLLFTVCSSTYEALFEMDANVLRAWCGSSYTEGERWVGRSGPQPRCVKLSAKVQAAKWAKFTSGRHLASIMESP